MTCRPGHSPRHPDFERGNQLARTHGVFVGNRAELVAAEVSEIAEQVADQYGWTAAYEDERRAYARAVVDERDLRSYLDQVGILDEHGHERPAVRTLERFHARAARCRTALGINPASHARILQMVADVVRRHPDRTGAPLSGSLDALLAQGRAALERRAERHQEAP